MNIPDSNLPRVVVIGGGFGGLELAKALRKKPFQVVLIDRNNYHTFQPLLYQVATAGLEPDAIAFPIRKIFKRQANFYFRMAEVIQIKPDKKELLTNIGGLNYDYLVVATGSRSNYFGMKEMQEHSMPMKSVPEALNLRSLILQNFEAALLTSDLEERHRLMNIVIIGGGPTGVEIAGALAELKRHVLPKDYPDLDLRQMNIHLVEAGDRLLATMHKVSSEKATDFLEELGITIWLNTKIEDFDGEIARTEGDKNFATNTVIWTAGVKAASLPGLESFSNAPGGRIRVDEFNRIGNFTDLFAIGDVAYMETKNYPKGHPMLAPVSIQQGKLLAKNLQKLVEQKEMIPFRYKDEGTMATIGRNRAVVELPKFRFQGLFAWFVWMGVHLMSLVGFRNRAIVLIDWIWNYFNYDRSIRLIIRPFDKKPKATVPASVKPAP